VCCVSAVLDYFLDEALVSIFNNDLYLQQIVLTVPIDCSEGEKYYYPYLYFQYINTLDTHMQEGVEASKILL
jgi:hypothetical protein